MYCSGIRSYEGTQKVARYRMHTCKAIDGVPPPERAFCFFVFFPPDNHRSGFSVSSSSPNRNLVLPASGLNLGRRPLPPQTLRASPRGGIYERHRELLRHLVDVGVAQLPHQRRLGVFDDPPRRLDLRPTVEAKLRAACMHGTVRGYTV